MVFEILPPRFFFRRGEKLALFVRDNTGCLECSDWPNQFEKRVSNERAGSSCSRLFCHFRKMLKCNAPGCGARFRSRKGLSMHKSRYCGKMSNPLLQVGHAKKRARVGGPGGGGQGAGAVPLSESEAESESDSESESAAESDSCSDAPALSESELDAESDGARSMGVPEGPESEGLFLFYCFFYCFFIVNLRKIVMKRKNFRIMMLLTRKGLTH